MVEHGGRAENDPEHDGAEHDDLGRARRHGEELQRRIEEAGVSERES